MTLRSHSSVTQNIMYLQDFATARNAFPIRFGPLYHGPSPVIPWGPAAEPHGTRQCPLREGVS